MSLVATAARTRVRTASLEAARLYADLKAAPLRVRRRYMAELTAADWVQVLDAALRRDGTPYALWADDPVGFVTEVLGESTWSKSREILRALASDDTKIAVPSCFSSSKTWTASRALLWFACVHAPGTAKVITMAPTWRQVARLLWSEVRYAHQRVDLPGTVDMVQLKMPTQAGTEEVVAYGLSGAPTNEAQVQGIHAPNLLLIVDEAGGIAHTIGRNLRGMTSTEGSRMLAIGNPPTDEQGSWFETLCNLEESRVIPISAFATPACTGEAAPTCRSCVGGIEHTMAKHLVTADWITETIAEHGEDSPYVQAKVYARFPTGGPSQVLPATWVDNAADPAGEPEHGEDWVRLDALGLAGEGDPWRVRLGSWVRLGVDVAADGGDELAIARCVGDLVTVRRASAGQANASAVDVAGVVLEEIRQACALARALGTTAPVRVKIDGIGVGWGVASLLKSWGDEGVHDAQIVSTVVSERVEREPDGATLRPYRKRDEMWLAMRSLLQPRPGGGAAVRLRVDRRTLAQLRSPRLATNATGWTVVESKRSMKDRGLSSPDRAEAVLLAVYEPVNRPLRKPAKLLV